MSDFVESCPFTNCSLIGDGKQNMGILGDHPAYELIGNHSYLDDNTHRIETKDFDSRFQIEHVPKHLYNVKQLRKKTQRLKSTACHGLFSWGFPAYGQANGKMRHARITEWVHGYLGRYRYRYSYTYVYIL